MDIHKNARSCPASRALLVRRILEQGWSLRSAAEAAGLSERTAYKWLARYREAGPGALEDRSSCPRQMPTKTPDATIDQVLALRRQRRVGAEIAARLGLPRSTVARLLKRHGLGKLRALDPPPAPTQRYCRHHPGELLHLDVKKLGKIRGIGRRVTGNQRDRARGVGWEYVHVCVDDASRLAYVEIMPDERKGSAVAFLERALAWFARQGVRVQAVMTDNAPCYISKHFATACCRQALRHVRIRPYRPQTNGKAERFIQTMLREWAYRWVYRSSAQRRERLRVFLHFYNYHRQHQSLDSLPPASRLPNLNNVLRMHT